MRFRLSAVVMMLGLAGCVQQGPAITELTLPAATPAAGQPSDRPAAQRTAVDTETPLAAPGAVAPDLPEAAEGVQVVQGESGLLERLPDTCRLDDYRGFVGQPAATVSVSARPYRVIGPGDIVTQEYDPMRVNFFHDGAEGATGLVTRVSCG